MNSSSTNITGLFQTAQAEGTISPASAKALNIVDIGAQIQAGLGISVDDVQASEVILVTQLIDDSGSIRFVQGNTQAVRDGHNLVLDALGDSKQDGGILTHTRYLNGHVLFPYCRLSQAIRMDAENYDPKLGTPLYDQILLVLATVLAKAQEFADNGVPVRTVTGFTTDGRDEHSPRNRGGKGTTPSQIATVIRDMLMAENHIVAGMGISDGGSTDFRQIFGEMGIRDEWILTPGNTPSEIRRAFGALSKSAVRASQGAKSFSKTAMGGFGTP